MNLDLTQLRKNYESYDNDKLVKLATEEATELRPEALELLVQIIRERGLSEDVINGVAVQFEEIDEKSLQEYTNLLKNLPCPICKSTHLPLNAGITGIVTSYLIMSSYEKRMLIACPDCLDKKNNEAIKKSLLFGWWGFPWGIIYTLQSLIFNNSMKKANKKLEVNDLFKSFVLERIGKIEASRNNSNELQQIITNIKKWN